MNHDNVKDTLEPFLRQYSQLTILQNRWPRNDDSSTFSLKSETHPTTFSNLDLSAALPNYLMIISVDTLLAYVHGLF